MCEEPKPASMLGPSEGSQQGEVTKELASVHREVSDLALRLEYQKQYQDVVEKIRQLELNLEYKWLVFKVASVVGGILLSAAGLFGYRSLQDLRSSVNTEIQDEVKESKAFYDDLMAGAALTVRKNYAAAIPRLKRCFDHGHEYDKGVLLPLLVSLNLTDDWEEALPIITRLRSDVVRYDAINDASVYTIVGSILVQEGVSEWSRGVDSGAGSKTMDDGYAILNNATALITPNDSDTRMHVYNNLWIFYVARKQLEKAKSVVDALKGLPNDQRVYSWESMRLWRCMRDLKEKEPALVSQAAFQWKELASRYKPTE